MKPIFLVYKCRACRQRWEEVDNSASDTVEIAARALTNGTRLHYCNTYQADFQEGVFWGVAELISARDYA